MQIIATQQTSHNQKNTKNTLYLPGYQYLIKLQQQEQDTNRDEILKTSKDMYQRRFTSLQTSYYDLA